jgi:hypothetical protein
MSYCQIQLPEVQTVLKADKGWKDVSGSAGEYIYQFEPPSFPGLAIKVYSSVRKRDGKGRGRGHDAIRVCAVYLPKNRGVVKVSRVYREPGWQARLESRVIDVIAKAFSRREWITGTGR